MLVLGPDSSVSPLIFAAITPLLVAGGDPAKAIALAGMMAVLVGLIEIGLGLGKLGFVADLLSKEVQVGYMNGLGITIIVGQLPKLFGFSTDGDGFIDEVRQFLAGLDETNTTALVLGGSVLVLLLVLPRITTKVPAVLVAVIGATVVTAVFDLAAEGVAVTGPLPQGVPAPSRALDGRGRRRGRCSSRPSGSPWSRSPTPSPLPPPSRPGEATRSTRTRRWSAWAPRTSPPAFFQGFAVSTSGSRTAVAEQAGAKSQVTGLVGAGVVILLLLVFNTLVADLPQTALAAVVIAAALSLMDLAMVRRYARVRPSALVLSLVATVGRGALRGAARGS